MQTMCINSVFFKEILKPSNHSAQELRNPGKVELFVNASHKG